MSWDALLLKRGEPCYCFRVVGCAAVWEPTTSLSTSLARTLCLLLIAVVGSCSGLLPNSAVSRHMANRFEGAVNSATPVAKVIHDRGIRVPDEQSDVPLLELLQAELAKSDTDGTFAGITYDLTRGNGLPQGWLVQSPNVWGRRSSDVLAGHSDALVLQIHDLVASAQHRVDIAGLAPSPDGQFLAALRERATRHGALLVFDEVITGFRVGSGGAQARYGITPDVSIFGKVIGGGLPLAAVGGRAAVMDELAPLGPGAPQPRGTSGRVGRKLHGLAGVGLWPGDRQHLAVDVRLAVTGVVTGVVTGTVVQRRRQLQRAQRLAQQAGLQVGQRIGRRLAAFERGQLVEAAHKSWKERRWIDIPALKV